MSTSITINYDTLENICNKSKSYMEALEEIKCSLNSINTLVEYCKGETAQELLNCHEDLQNNLIEVLTEVRDINSIFENYTNDMQSIIPAKDSSSNILIDRDNIWRNIENICGACEVINTLEYSVGAFRGLPSFNLTDEEKSNQESNYKNLENIWSIIKKYGNILSQYEDEMKNLFNTKILDFDETDSNYRNSAKSQLHDKYADTWTSVRNCVFNGGKTEFDIWKKHFDLVKNFITKVNMLAYESQEIEQNDTEFSVSVITAGVTGDEPDWAKDNIDYKDKFKSGVQQLLYDSSIVANGLCQSKSDAYQEEAVVYCIG